MLESTITSKGQTTIPKEVRDALGVSPGDRLRYFIDERGVRLVRTKPAAHFFGMLRRYYDGPVPSVEEMRQGVADHLAEKHMPKRGAPAANPAANPALNPAENSQ